MAKTSPDAYPRDPKDLLTELDSAAIRCAAAALALERAQSHRDPMAEHIRADVPVIRERLREITNDIMDLWSVIRAEQTAAQRGKVAA